MTACFSRPARLARLACSIVLALTACSNHPSSGDPGSTPDATVQGQVMTDHGPVIGHTSAGVTAYLGIRYAAPPVGSLRWRPPADPAPWTQPFDAAALGPACAQSSGGIGQGGPYSEDCLTVNVWLSALSSPMHAPVMVFLHGGAFIHGSSNEAGYDGATIAASGGVIVVTLNYRLGVLGYLAHPAMTAEDDHHSSGNTGMLDQLAALRWVQANIAAFGGDPGNVTVFGESAGGMSSCLLVTSPLAAGLFHRAISESGPCTAFNTPLHTSTDGSVVGAEAVGERVAQKLGCDTASDVLGCLRAKSADDVIAAAPGSEDDLVEGLELKPNIDGYVLAEPPSQALAAGRINAIDGYLEGINHDEATLFTQNTTIDTEADYEAAVAHALPTHTSDALALYPASSYPTPKDAYNAMITDLIFACPTRAVVRSIAGHGGTTYLYELTRMTTLGAATALAVYHGSELPFVFGNLTVASGMASDDRAFSDQLIGYWTRFAKTGDPNGNGAVTWAPRTADTENYLELDTPFQPRTGLHQKTCDTIESWFAKP
jgi:para-nitrobenzyl esterase